jgi:hypothetical protein
MNCLQDENFSCAAAPASLMKKSVQRIAHMGVRRRHRLTRVMLRVGNLHSTGGFQSAHRLIGSSAHRLIGSSAHRLIGSSAHRLIGSSASTRGADFSIFATPEFIPGFFLWADFSRCQSSISKPSVTHGTKVFCGGFGVFSSAAKVLRGGDEVFYDRKPRIQGENPLLHSAFKVFPWKNGVFSPAAGVFRKGTKVLRPGHRVFRNKTGYSATDNLASATDTGLSALEPRYSETKGGFSDRKQGCLRRKTSLTNLKTWIPHRKTPPLL